jgi:translation initiation factor 2D
MLTLFLYSVSALYTLSEIRTILNNYITAQDLVNKNEQQYINLDNVLSAVMTSKVNEPAEFMKRDELMRKLVEKMQHWYEVQVEGKESMVKYELFCVHAHPEADQ